MVDTTADFGVAADRIPLDDDYAGPRNLPVETVVSADGTTIAYEVSGSGPAVVVIGGGLNDRAMFAPFAAMLAEDFTVYNYDRRGRGDSGYGDPDQYTIDREVEDLAAVIKATGGPAMVFANCTGAIIAIHAAAAGVPMAKLGMYEPPYEYPRITPENMAKLRKLVIEDRREEAVTLFGVDVVGFLTRDTVEAFKQHPAWAAFESMAPSLIYDAIIDEQHSSIPYQMLPDVTPPTLIMCGCESAQSIQDACATLSEKISDARLIRMEGEGHLFNQRTGAPLFAEFFRS